MKCDNVKLFRKTMFRNADRVRVDVGPEPIDVYEVMMICLGVDGQDTGQGKC